jgi:uncharacterized protein involved in cysteine biosynthesis
MNSQPHHRSKWRKFKHEHGLKIFIGLLLVVVVALVVLLMWFLSNPNLRLQPEISL